MKTAIFKFIGLCCLSILAMSCKGLQYREANSVIEARHKQLRIPTELSTYEVEELDRKIRVQSVKMSKNDINVVFFHGSPSSMAAWRSYLVDTSLVKKANLYAIDRPGYGYSGFGDELTSITQQAKIMSELLDAYNLDNVVLVGASYGGPLAARIGVINDKVKAVIMVSPAIDPKQEKDIWASRLTQWWLTRWLVPRGYRVAGDEKTTHAKELELLEKDWPRLTAPVIHIHGDIDEIVPYGNVNYSKNVFENIEIIQIPNAGHEIAWQRSELIKPEIEAIITEILEELD